MIDGAERRAYEYSMYLAPDLRAMLHNFRNNHPYYVPTAFFILMQGMLLGALMREDSTRLLLFWYCNNISFFFAIAFWEKKLQIVKGLSYVGILTQLLWISDFLSHLVGFDLSNTANYVFIEGFTFANDVSVMVHFGVPIVALLYTVRVRPEPYSLFYSMLYIGGLYVATIAGTAPLDDINCVYNACSQYPFPYHAILWPLYLVLLSLGGFALHEGLYRLWARYRAPERAV